MQTNRLFILIFLGFLTACSMTSDKIECCEKVLSDERTVEMEKGLYEYPLKRNGASFNKEGYRHVLGKRNDMDMGVTKDNQAPSGKVSESIDRALSIDEKGDRSKISYSVYELSRWGRFCGDGKMDIRDWNFIDNEGPNNMPEYLSDTCAKKSYGKIDYIVAWKETCGNRDRTAEGKKIRAESIKPKNICADF